MVMSEKQHKIMAKPLPAILDELDESIQELRETIKEAKEAIAEANVATREARAAGESAGERAKQIATEGIGKMGRDLADTEAKLRNEILSAQSEMLQQLVDVRAVANAALNEHRAFRAAIVRGLNFTGEEINKNEQ